MLKIIFTILFFSFSKLNSTEIHNLPVYNLKNDRFTIHKELDNFTSEKILMINFTNSNCKPCKEEIPKLIEWEKKWKSSGFVLWIVFVGDEDFKIEEMKKKLHIPQDVRVFKDPLEISFKRLNYNAFPANFIINKNKDLIYMSLGYTISNMNKLENIVREKLK